jgi:hypothetical protein
MIKSNRIACAAGIAAALMGVAHADMVTDWNQTAMQAVAELPPPPQARVMAMVQAAVYDAVNAIDRHHAAYAVDIQAHAHAMPEAAAATAAHDVLVRLLPAQQPTLDAALLASLAPLAEGDDKTHGIDVGRQAAAGILELRKGDGSAKKVTYSVVAGARAYQLTPPMNQPPVLPQWRLVKPFVLTSALQFKLPGPPAPGSADFERDLAEVKAIGSRGSTVRSNEQTATAIFWAGSEVPPLNAVARAASAAKGLGLMANARLLAYLNLAIADSSIAGFEYKYSVNFWRPITAIRSTADGSAADRAWEPLLVTPPHPEYPSAHCLATGAAAQVLLDFLGSDKVSVSVVQPPLGVLHHWDSVAQIVKEVEDARVWGGIHYRTSDEHGTQLGRRVADFVLHNALQPLEKTSKTASQ